VIFYGIPILNRLDLLARATAAIDYPCDLVVVNNNVRDEGFCVALRQFVLECGYGLIEPGRNLGVAASWNLLLRVAFDRGYDQALIGSNDTFLNPGSLACVATLSPCEDVALWHLCGFDCFLVQRRTVDRVGWFDENFYPAYKEDQDYTYRCRLAGLDSQPVSGASAQTVGSATLNSVPGYRAANTHTYDQNVKYYVNKWGGDSGQEQFTAPFNRPELPLSWWPVSPLNQSQWDWDGLLQSLQAREVRTEKSTSASSVYPAR
jgi:hypothetical protein